MHKILLSIREILQFFPKWKKVVDVRKKYVIIICSAIKIPEQSYDAQYRTGGEVRCESMSNVIVKENESLDSALRRFKRNCAKAGDVYKRQISDKSQIFQLARALSEGEQIIAEIAPAFTGQFGDNINARNLKAALEELGFSQVYEVAPVSYTHLDVYKRQIKCTSTDRFQTRHHSLP